MANETLEKLLNDSGLDYYWDKTKRYVNSRTAALGTVTLEDNVKLLWENASPSSTFGAETIDLDLSEYDFVMVICGNSTTGSVSTSTTITPIGKQCIHYTQPYYLRYRTYTVSVTGIEFTPGYHGNASNTVNGDNGVVIPQKIYGIKLNHGALATVDGIDYRISPVEYDELMGLLD